MSMKRISRVTFTKASTKNVEIEIDQYSLAPWPFFFTFISNAAISQGLLFELNVSVGNSLEKSTAMLVAEVNPCGGFRGVHGPFFGNYLRPDSMDSKSDRAPIQKGHISNHHDKVSRAPGRVLLFELHVFVRTSLGKSTAMLIAEVTIHWRHATSRACR